MSHLSERAEAVQAWLEGEWRKAYLKRGGCRWRSANLVKRLLSQRVCKTELDGWEALKELTLAGVIDSGAPLSARQRINVQIDLSEALRHRLETTIIDVDDSLALNVEQAAVWRHALDGLLYDWTLSDQRRLVQGLRALSQALPGAYTLSAFEASARYLMNSSKLLSSLPRELVRAFAIEPSSFRSPTAWVLAAMPQSPQGLLLIENPHSFNQACRLGLDQRLALICSFGYGLSLANALVQPQRVHLIGEGALPLTLSELLELPTVTYWGDLDPEGLRIFLRLQHTVPQLRLSALYAPMIEALEEEEGGHPLHVLTGKAEQRTGDEWARGVDQEWLDDALLEKMAGQALDEPTQRRWLGRVRPSDDSTST